jgi:hypothetical protein
VLFTRLAWLRMGTDGESHVNTVMNLRLPQDAGKLSSICTTGGLSSNAQLKEMLANCSIGHGRYRKFVPVRN